MPKKTFTPEQIVGKLRQVEVLIAGIAESTMLSLMGHMSRSMLERYSHIRIAAKREAVEALSLRTFGGVSTISTTVDRNGAARPVLTH